MNFFLKILKISTENVANLFVAEIKCLRSEEIFEWYFGIWNWNSLKSYSLLLVGYSNSPRHLILPISIYRKWYEFAMLNEVVLRRTWKRLKKRVIYTQILGIIYLKLCLSTLDKKYFHTYPSSSQTFYFIDS